MVIYLFFVVVGRVILLLYSDFERGPYVFGAVEIRKSHALVNFTLKTIVGRIVGKAWRNHPQREKAKNET